MGKKGKRDRNDQDTKEKKLRIKQLLNQAKDSLAVGASQEDTHVKAIKDAAKGGSASDLEILRSDFAEQYPKIVLQMQRSVLTSIDESFSLEQISTILNALQINLSKIPTITADTPTGVKTFDIAIYLMRVVHQNWKSDPTKAQQLLELFVSKNLSTQLPEIRSNVILQCVQAYHQDIDFIKMLLDSGHFNVNTVLSPKLPPEFASKIVYAQTPFSTAFSCLNKELMEVLLEYGADPYLAGKHSASSVQRRLASISSSAEITQVMVAHQFGIERLSYQQKEQHYLEVDSLIKKFFLQELEKLTTKWLQDLEKENTKALAKQARAEAIAKKKAEKAASSKATQKAADEELTPKGGAAAEEELAPKGAPADAEAPLPRAAEVRISEPEFLDRFIDSQEQAARNVELPEEIREGSKFDALVLRYIKTKNQSTLEEISELLSGPHSAKNSRYYIKVLTELGTSMEDAGEILATTPRLLHKFCTVHKEIQSSASIAAEPEEQSFGDDVYPVAGTKIFLQIDPELITSLSEDQLTKIQSQLSSPRFIAKNSLGISGVKDYGHNISKLKIAGPDSNLVSTLRYKDEDGNLLIVFNQFLSHQETEALKRGECIRIERIQDAIIPVSTEDELPPLEESQTPIDELSSGAPDDEVELAGDGLE